jgi:hypothetical protein
MDRIIINIVDHKTDFVRRIVLEVSATLSSCDFITLGEELMFDRDTDFLTFGFDATGGSRQLAVVAGEGHGMEPRELAEAILAATRDRFSLVKEEESQVWLREKSA